MSVRVNPEVLHYEADIRGLNGRALARTAKVSDATVSTAYAGKPISMTSARLIARALEITPVDEGLRRLLGDGPGDPDD